MEETKNVYQNPTPKSKNRKSEGWSSDILDGNISSNSLAILKDTKIEGNESTILEKIVRNSGDEIKNQECGDERTSNKYDTIDKNIKFESTQKALDKHCFGNLNSYGVHKNPTTNDSHSISDGKVKIKKHYLAMNKEDLKTHGVSGWRLKIAFLLKNKVYYTCSTMVLWLYTLLIFIILGIEKQIYESSAATHVIDISEIIIVSFFAIELITSSIAFGIVLFSTDLWNFAEITLIILSVIWGILDLIDSAEFRVLGAYRVFRVLLLYVKLYHWKLQFDSRKYINNVDNHTKSPMQQVCNILTFLKDNIQESKLCYDIMYWLDVIVSGSIYTKSVDMKACWKNSEDLLAWARHNTDGGDNKYYGIQKSIENQITKYDIDNELNLSPKIIDILEQWNEYEFDIFALEKETQGNELVVLSTYLLFKHDLFTDLSINPSTFNSFVTAIQNGYWDIPYHNKTHGADVGRLSYYYSMNCGLKDKTKMNNLDLVSLVIAGVCHDFEHLGFSNQYLIETQHEWAITYNDIAVCENHHIAATFDIILKRKGCNLFENFSLQDFKNVRRKMTKSVLATDMACHNEHFKDFKKLVADKHTDFTTEENKTFMMGWAVHFSDLTNPTKQWCEAQKWLWLVYEEYFNQGDKEREMGLPIGSLNDRININIAKDQLGFIDFVIQPTFDTLSTFLPLVQRNADQCRANREKLVSMTSEYLNIQKCGNNLMKRYYELDCEETENPQDHSSRSKNIITPISQELSDLDLENNGSLLSPTNKNPTFDNILVARK